MSDFKLDMLLCIVPKINPDAPTIGPAILKAHLQDAGYTCEVLDLNIKLYNALKKIDKHDYYFFKNDSIFSTSHHDVKDGKFEFTDDFKTFYKETSSVFMEWVDIFKEKNPRWIGLSLLTFYSQSVAIMLSCLIRKFLPDTKIVWGGAQIEYGNDKFKDIGLMDHYICGDGEIAIIELLNGNTTAPGIDTIVPTQVLDMSKIKIPDYDDIIWDEYQNLDYENPIYITGSRGCVKKCTFCNVDKIWPEYRFKSGKQIAHEIITLRKKYNRKHFKFTDSLINGSMKAFRELLNELKEYRKTDPDFMWSSQWIVRSITQSPESDYQLMADSGCFELDVGIESFSQDIRYHMGKKFTDDDMWWCLEMLKKYKIRHTVLMITGYPTETDADHQHTLDTIRKLYDIGHATAKNDYGNRLLYLSFGHTMMLSDVQPIYELIKDDLTNFNNSNTFEWDYKGNTLPVRVKRYKEIHELIATLNNQPDSSWLIRRELRMLDNLPSVKNDNA